MCDSILSKCETDNRTGIHNLELGGGGGGGGGGGWLFYIYTCHPHKNKNVRWETHSYGYFA